MRRFLLIFMLLVAIMPSYCQTNISALRSKLANTTSDKEKVSLYLSISKYFQSKRADSATYYAIAGLKLATRIHNKRAQAQMLYQLGVINVQHNNLGTAHRHLMAALEIFKQQDDRKNLILTYEELGIAESRSGHHQKAAEYINKAIELSLEVKDTVSLIQSYLKMGNVEEHRNNTPMALNYYRKAEELNAGLSLDRLNPAVAYHIGKTHLKEGAHGHAITHFKKSIAQTDNAEHGHKHVSYLSHTGEAYQKQGNDDSALAFHNDALMKARMWALPEEQARALIKIAGIVKKSDATSSLEHLNNALMIARDISHPQLSAEVYKAMAEVYRYQERYSEALFALEQQHELLDSLFRINKNQEMAGLRAQNEMLVSTEKLELDNQKLRFQIMIVMIVLLAAVLIALFAWNNARKTKAVNVQLAESNHVKDRLFSIIGHDLRGPIGNMPQLLSILEMDGIPPEEQKEIVGIMKQQCNASFEVLNSLLSWGKIQLQGVSVSMEDFLPNPLVDKNMGVLRHLAKEKSLTLTNDVPTELTVHADAAHFDFIIRNLLSNAIKFSHTGGSIGVRTEPADAKGFVTFAVNDTGKGISEEQQQQFLKSNINVSYGTNGEKGTGLGLMIIKEFVQSNGGKIWLESEEGRGSTFYFSLQGIKNI